MKILATAHPECNELADTPIIQHSCKHTPTTQHSHRHTPTIYHSLLHVSKI